MHKLFTKLLSKQREYGEAPKRAYNSIGYLIIRDFFSIGLDKIKMGLYIQEMRRQNIAKRSLKEKEKEVKVDNFVTVQFQQLLNRNLGIPIKTFQL